MKKDKDKILVVAQEIHFAKALAANDKLLRERALRRLNKWLSLKAKSSLEFTEEGFMRIWKGLFYCVWMSDKPLIQESTVESISHLLHCFLKFHDSLMFMRCFYQAMSQAWFGLDQHRLDKFMMLVRRFTRQSFAVLKKEGWQEDHVRDLGEMIFKALTVAPVGFILHLADVYIVELSKVGEGKLKSEVVVELVKPWAKLLATSSDMRIINAIKSHVFLYLIRQTDLALKHDAKYEVWKNLGFPGGDINTMVEAETDSEPEISTDEDEMEEEDVFLDPRAGHGDTVLPPVDFQPGDIVNLLNTTKINQQRTLAARQSKSISSLIDKFKQLEKQKYPLGIHKVSNFEDESSEDEVENAVKRLSSFHQELYISSGSKLKRKTILKGNDVGNTVWDISDSSTDEKGIKLILSPYSSASSPWTVNEVENGEIELTPRIKKRKLSNSLSNGFQTPCSSSSATSEAIEDSASTPLINSRKNNLKTGNGDLGIDITGSKSHLSSKKLGKQAVKKTLTPVSEKKVLFALSKNRAQEPDEYVKTVEKSPMIPYDASKKPRQGVLKPSALASPINPFYMRKLNRLNKKKSI